MVRSNLVVLFGSITIFLVYGFFLHSRIWSPTPATTQSPQPELDFLEQIDLGEREIDSIADVIFSLGNKGTRILHVEKITADCSCLGLQLAEPTSASSSLESISIAPQESIKLKVSIPIGNRSGAMVEQSIRFFTNDPNRPAPVITIVAKPTQYIYANPAGLHFGGVVRNSLQESSVDVFSSMESDAEKNPRITSSNPALISTTWETASDSKIRKLGVYRIGRLHVALKVPVDVRHADERISFQFERREEKPLVIPIYCSTVAAIAIEPRQLSLPRHGGRGIIYDGICICRALKGLEYELILDKPVKGIDVRIEPVASHSEYRMIRIDAKERFQTNGTGLRDPVLLRFKAIAGNRTEEFDVQLNWQPEVGEEKRINESIP